MRTLLVSCSAIFSIAACAAEPGDDIATADYGEVTAVARTSDRGVAASLQDRAGTELVRLEWSRSSGDATMTLVTERGSSNVTNHFDQLDVDSAVVVVHTFYRALPADAFSAQHVTCEGSSCGDLDDCISVCGHLTRDCQYVIDTWHWNSSCGIW